MGVRITGHFDDVCVNLHLTDRMPKPRVVGEDDDLPGKGDLVQHTRETIHLGRVHRLDRIVYH